MNLKVNSEKIMLSTKICKVVEDKGGIVMKKFKKIIAFCLSFALTLILLPVDNAFAAASAAPAKPTVTHNQWGTDVDGNYDITSSIWYGNNATSYKVFERFGTSGEFELIDEGKLEDGTPAAQSIVTEVRNRSKSGIYYYYTSRTPCDCASTWTVAVADGRLTCPGLHIRHAPTHRF